MPHAVVGFKPRTGRAILVMLVGDRNGAQVIERSEVPLLPAGEFATYHAAKELAPEEAPRYVAGSIERAQRLATSAVRGAMKRCAAAGHRLRGCGVLVGTGMPSWTTAEILAVHARMHQAEGELFRSVLLKSAQMHGLVLTTLPDKSVFDAAAGELGMTLAKLDASLTALGRDVGPPWGQYQKAAAAVALVALARAEVR